MSDLVKRLNESRLRIYNEMKALVDRAEDEKRAFTGEEEQTWTRLNDQIGVLDERIKSVAAQEQRAKEADDALFGGRERTGKQPGGDEKADELRAWARGEGGRAYTVMPPATGKISGPINYRSLSKLSGGAGGDTVPTSFYNRLVEHLIENSGLLQAGCFVLNTASGEQIPVPKTTAHPTGARMNEGGTIPTSDPAFGTVELGAYKYGVKVQVTRELITDTGVDLEGYLARATGRALANAFGVDMATGTGAGQPRGILTDTTAGATGTTGVSGGFGAQATAGQGGDYLIDLYHSVIAPYRASASCHWVMDDTTAAVVRKLKDSQGQYVWQPSLVAGDPDTILGKSVVIDTNIPNVALSAKSVLFGDFSTYFVRMAGGIRFERSDDFAFDQDLITYRALMRADAALVDLTGSIKHFVGGAS